MGFFIKIYDQASLLGGRVKSSFNNLLSFLFVKIFLGIILLLNLLSWYFSYFLYSRVKQDIVILHYNVNFGINLIGSKINFFAPSAIGLFFFLINILVLLLMAKRDDFRFWFYFLLSFLLLLNVFLIISLFVLRLINF